MTLEGILISVWSVSSLFATMIFVLDEKMTKENFWKVILFSLIPFNNTVFVFRSIISWFK